MNRAGIRPTVQLVVLVAFCALVLVAHRLEGRDWLSKAIFWFDPLVLLATALATWTIPLVLCWSLVMVAATAVLGRVFCGWVCPLGTIHALASRFFRWLRKKPLQPEYFSPWQRTKYFLLVGMLVMAVLGARAASVFDPLVLLYRTTATALVPAAQGSIEESATLIWRSEVGLGPWRLSSWTDPVKNYLKAKFSATENRVAFLGGGLIFLLFGITVALNAWRRRFWCRYLCPLGALLGLCAWRPLLRRALDKNKCNQCGLCAGTCHGGASATDAQRWVPSECFVCLNCSGARCRAELGFVWVRPWRSEPPVVSVDLSKRALLGAAVGGVAGLGLLRLAPIARESQHARELVHRFPVQIIRPPGARPEREFLERCTGCGLCMKVCPTGGLQPALLEGGLEALWTPRLVPSIGYCLHECNRCGHVCPTDAIQPLTLEQKQELRIGLAAFDTSRCLPYAYARDCMVCEEVCPVPNKAIYFIETSVQLRDGTTVVVKQPRVDPDLCIGCGMCEHVCVYRDRPAIHVFPTNETRHPGNQRVEPSGTPYGMG